MVFKKLDELTAAELRIELRRAGIVGKYVKSQAIMRLTTHLVDISEDPHTFEFDPEVPIDETVGDNNIYEVDDGPDANTAVTTAGVTAASVSGLVGAINAGPSGVSATVTLPSQTSAFVSTSAAAMTTSTVTTSTASASSLNFFYSSTTSCFTTTSSFGSWNLWRRDPESN